MGFTREIPEHKQQLTTYPDKVSPMLSSSSSSSSSWQTNKQTKTKNHHDTSLPGQVSARGESGLLSACSGAAGQSPAPSRDTVTHQAWHDKGCLPAVGGKMAPAVLDC